MSDARRPTLSEEVELQLRKIAALKDKHALALFWRAIREALEVAAPPARLVVVAALLAALLAPQVGAAADPATVRLGLEATTSVALSSIADRAHVIVVRIGRSTVACGTIARLR